MKTNKKPFNPQDWQDPEPAKAKAPAKNTGSTAHPVRGSIEGTLTEDEAYLELITQRIESTATDLTANYDQWLHIGFALANLLGENGRPYFHRLSSFYPNYDKDEADKKYTSCLQGRRKEGATVTIGTLYHYAEQAGIDMTRHRQQNPQKTKFKGNEGMRE